MIKFTQQSDLMPYIASDIDSEFGADFDTTFALHSHTPDYKTRAFSQSYKHNRSHSPSVSSTSGLSTPSFPPSEYSKSDYAMSYHGDEEAQPFYYTPGTESNFYQPSTAPSTIPMESYAYAEDYSHIEQQPWSTPSLYAQQHEFSGYPEVLPSSIYQPSSVHPSLTSTNLIPPTPQSPMPIASFDFNTAPQQIYLNPSMSNSRSRENSIHSFSRSTSPASNLSSSPSAASLQAYGTLVVSNSHANNPQSWRCAFPGCTSRALFTRGCDLRKHYNRHSKHLFCRVDGCPQAEPKDSSSSSVGFSSKKDRARHEAKHNPGIPCEWRDVDGQGCGRVFSRVDNMKDHVRRIHLKGNR
jgi:hypothetical protein